MAEVFLSDYRPSTFEEAKKLITDIRYEAGIVDQTDENELQKTSQDFASRYRRDREKHRSLLARYTKTVADQLYSSRFRFIYELLQNADDASYEEGIVPTLTFRIRNDTLIVESNEKGFTVANVRAICSTGESSKIDEKDSTGEKGFGFKSVFGIANKVHIQSGKFSFRFDHQRGQDGIGMVVPIWTDPDDDWEDENATRLTLHYAKSDQPSLNALLDEFAKIPFTIVFALRRIRTLSIEIDDVNSQNRTWTYQKHITGTDQISIVTADSSVPKASKRRFKTFSAVVSDMPETELRAGQTESDIVLAFPIDSTGSPRIDSRGQHVFAFLPIQRVSGISCLIHADFILSASREAIPENEWNAALRDGIAIALSRAVSTFCADGSCLRYQWMRYLPTSHLEGFWEILPHLVGDALLPRNVLESRKGKRLTTIDKVRELPQEFLVDDEPLVPDLPQCDVYLSEKYATRDLAILRRTGLRELSHAEMIARIRQDIGDSSGRLRSKPLDDLWHNHFVNFIDYLLHAPGNLDNVHALDFIPLSSGKWVSLNYVARNSVYTPYAINAGDGQTTVLIPESLNIDTLHETAYSDGERATFFTAHEISDCPSDVLLRKIKEAAKFHRSSSITGFISYLAIMFWYGQLDISLLPVGSGRIRAVDESNRLRHTSNLFLPSKRTYDAADLLSQTTLNRQSSHGMLSESYLLSPVKDFRRNERTWEQWLEKIAGISYFPSLTTTSNSTTILNPVLQTVAKDNPSKFVPNLKAHWQAKYIFEPWEYVSKEISGILVPCCDGISRPLSGTILPFEKAVAEAASFGLGQHMPFLELPPGSLTEGIEPWRFLAPFGVLCDLSLDFYTLMLQQIREDRGSDDLHPGCIRLYEMVAKKANLEDSNELKVMFREKGLILDPRNLGWIHPSWARWKGPPVLNRFVALESHYGSNSQLQHLFVNLLEIPDATMHDIVHDLTDMKQQASNLTNIQIERIVKIYETLSAMVSSTRDIQLLRTKFGDDQLVYVRGRWCSPLSGIWSCDVELSGRFPLEDTYPELKDFFVNKLGVVVADSGVLIEELRQEALRAPADQTHLKDIMRLLSQLIAKESDATAHETQLRELRKVKFLPVRTGQVCNLEKLNGAYFVVDHERYGAAFSGKLALLDFPYSDMSILLPLLNALKIPPERYLSQGVSPETVVGSSVKNTKLTKHLRSRAYALSCCAISHKSVAFQQKKEGTYQMLLDAEVFSSEDMWTDLVVTVGEQEVKVRSDRAVIKVSTIEGRLKVIAPSDEALLYSCYKTELPASLARILQIEGRAADKQIYRILLDEAASLDELMKIEDIPAVDWLDRSIEDASSIVPQPAQNQDSPSEDGTGVATPGSPGSSASGIQVSAQIANHQLTQAQARVYQLPAGLNALREVAQENRYKKLLDHVIRQARQIPANNSDPFSMDEMRAVLNDLRSPPENDPSLFFLRDNGETRFEEHAKIGAAGELFVLERLRALGLRDLDATTHWRSSIRGLVNIHPDYEHLQHPGGVEVADIEYDDSTNVLRQLLQSHGRNVGVLLDITATAAEPVKYLLEVKSTTGPCSTPLFMSSRQYGIMEEYRIPPYQVVGARVKNVYVLIRVYNLLSGSIGMEIFVDPWGLRDGMLKFSADPWKVTAVV